MTDSAAEPAAFLRRYEQATNSHDLQRVLPLIAEDAVYWFSDGSHRGRAEIAGAIERTFATIRDETYEISDVEWVALTPGHAVCRYRFSWTGVVDGQARSGAGRGTNVLVRRDGGWLVLHEHLSS